MANPERRPAIEILMETINTDADLAKEQAEFSFETIQPVAAAETLRERGRTLVEFHNQLEIAEEVPEGLREETAQKAELAKQLIKDPEGAKTLHELISPKLIVPGNNGKTRVVIGNVYSKIFADYFTDNS